MVGIVFGTNEYTACLSFMAKGKKSSRLITSSQAFSSSSRVLESTEAFATYTNTSRRKREVLVNTTVPKVLPEHTVPPVQDQDVLVEPGAIQVRTKAKRFQNSVSISISYGRLFPIQLNP